MSIETRPIPEPYRVETDKLNSLLERAIPGHSGPIEVREFAGGGSNPTYLITTSSAKFVLRRKPIGAVVPGAHAIDREYRVLTALSTTGYPVPKPLAYCFEHEIIGAEFYLMEFVDGRIFFDYSLPDLPVSDRSAIYNSMNSAIASLHSTDFHAIGLADFGKPGNYFERQIALWRRQYERTGKNIRDFELLSEWLSRNMIRDDTKAIVHGDFSLLNCVLSPSAPNIDAVLDWELSTIGHPLADFAYNLSHWYLPNTRDDQRYKTLVGLDVGALGIPSLKEYTEKYARRVSFGFGHKDIDFAIAFSLFRLAGISIGAAARAADGTAKNALAGVAAQSIAPILESAWEFALGGRGL